LSHLGRTGVAAFDFTVKKRAKKGGPALRAMKSYTVLDRCVVLVGTGVRLVNAELAKGKTVSTSIHQCPLRASDKTLIVNGREMPLADGKKRLEHVRWMHVRNYGYWFPKPVTLDLSVVTSTRGYKYINTRYGSDKPYTRRFYTISIDHGPQPKQGAYAAVVFPAVRAAEMPALADRPGVAIASSAAAHLVREEGGTDFCVFFAKDDIEGFRASRPLVTAVSAEGTSLRVTVQDPRRNGGKVRFRIPMKASGTGAKPDGDGTLVTTQLARGAPLTVELRR
jgi:hyaluronate lyase